jgi:FkbM family methyltransferase
MTLVKRSVRRHPWVYATAARWGWGDRALAELSAWAARHRGSPIRFVQIGSNDGVTSDPIHDLIVSYGWTGVLVEPVPSLFGKLQRSYPADARIRFRNVAVGEANGSRQFYTVGGALPGDPPWAHQIGSFDRQHVLRHGDGIPKLEQRLVVIEVKVETLATICTDLDAVDFLHIDAEGSDAVILRQVPLSGPQCPNAILFEHKHMTTREAEEIARRFPGYRGVRGRGDTFLIREGTAPHTAPL